MKLAYFLEYAQTPPEISASIQNRKNILEGILTQQKILSETDLLKKINIYRDVRSEWMLKNKGELISSLRAEDKAFWENKKVK